MKTLKATWTFETLRQINESHGVYFKFPDLYYWLYNHLKKFPKISQSILSKWPYEEITEEMTNELLRYLKEEIHKELYEELYEELLTELKKIGNNET